MLAWFLLVLSLGLGNEARAGLFGSVDRHTISETAIDLMGLKTPDADPGALFDFSSRRFSDNNHGFLGAGVLGGSIRDMNATHGTVFGAYALLGWEMVTASIVLGTELALGAATASPNSAYTTDSAATSFYFGPKVYTGISVGGGWRLQFFGGYAYLPTLTSSSGVTFGIRFASKIETTVKGVED